MKNKPDPALLRPSNLSNEIKKRVQKSRETIPLIGLKHCWKTCLFVSELSFKEINKMGSLSSQMTTLDDTPDDNPNDNTRWQN
jgi:hypothetical protein